MDADSNSLNDLSGRVIGSAYTVLNTLGPGFLEKVYENALALELRKAGLAVAQQRGVRVMYAGSVVGDYFTDLLVEDEIVVELKAVKALDEMHRAQCANYLKATGLRLGLVSNFGSPRFGIARVANHR